MLGAAYVAEADGILLAGGAHAVAAVAYGTESVPAVDVIVGPGNRWVTAAKQIVSEGWESTCWQVHLNWLCSPAQMPLCHSSQPT